jgi:hypothetical protein
MQHCGMPVLTLADFERTIRSSLDGDTYPSDAKTPWNPAYPTRGQCGVVTLVVNDLLGGELLRGEVHVDGQRVDFHWWNRLHSGIEVDLTRDQFTGGEIITNTVAIARPPNTEMKRLHAEYELLHRRVFDALGCPGGLVLDAAAVGRC